MIMRVFLSSGEGRVGRQSQTASCPPMPLPILIVADFGEVPLLCVLHLQILPALRADSSLPVLSRHIQMQSDSFCQLHSNSFP